MRCKWENTLAAKNSDKDFVSFDYIRCLMEEHGNDEFILKFPNSAGHKYLVKGEKTSVTWAKEDCRALDA
jgi:hypothetical protein